MAGPAGARAALANYARSSPRTSRASFEKHLVVLYSTINESKNFPYCPNNTRSEPCKMTSDARGRLLYLLKSRGPLTAEALARTLDISTVGARQHLVKLHDEGLVAFDDRAGEVGRPRRIWRL